MGFIKKNAFLLACALVGVVSLGLMLWGISNMSQVKSEMNKAVQLNQQLAGFTKNPVNTQLIEREEQRFEKVKEYHREVLSNFGTRAARQPLLEGVLPDPPRGPEGKKLRYEFRTKYREAMYDLLKRLKAGQPPTKEEIDYTTDYLKKKAMEAEQFGTPDDAATGSAVSARSAALGSGVDPKASKAMPERDGPASTQAYWEAVAERAATDPNMMISISKARGIYCYANLERGGSFELSPIFLTGDDSAPNMADIWFAQLWYWLQKDVVEVLARVNEEAAARVQDPWVGNLPVKDVLSMRVSDYLQEGTGAGHGESQDRPPSDPHAAWTHQSAHTLYDVVNLRIRLVIDQRDLPRVLDALTHDRYAAVLNVQYTAVKPDLSFRGKIYGPEPAVEVNIDLQTYLFYKAYVPWMPEVIRTQLGVQKQFEQIMEELGRDTGAEGQDEEGTGEGQG